MKENINVLIVQNHVKSEQIEYNRNNVYNMTETYLSSTNKSVDLIVLPEFFTGTPWYFPGRMHLKGIVDETIPGPTTEMFGALAKKHNCYMVCGSLVEREGDKYYNTATLIGPNGKIIGKTRKVHRYASEANYIDEASEFPLFDTELGKLGMVVCSDFWIMEVPRILALKGADLLAVPAASLIQNINTTIPSVQGIAVLNALPIAYASTVGKITGIREGKEVSIDFRGHSALVTPKELICSAKEEECALYGTLDMKYLSTLQHPLDMSADTLWWGLWGRKPELYKDNLGRYIKQTFDLNDWFKQRTKQN